MKKAFLHIGAAFLAIVLLASCAGKGKVIPRSEMQKIYADMFLADEWILDNFDFSKEADTLLFYEPIFKKYGYNTNDYIASVNHYLKDPVRYSRMLMKTKQDLDKTHKHLQDYKEALEKRDRDDERIRSYDPKLIYYYNSSFISMAENSRLRMAPIDTFGRYWPLGMTVTGGSSSLYGKSLKSPKTAKPVAKTLEEKPLEEKPQVKEAAPRKNFKLRPARKIENETIVKQ